MKRLFANQAIEICRAADCCSTLQWLLRSAGAAGARAALLQGQPSAACLLRIDVQMQGQSCQAEACFWLSHALCHTPKQPGLLCCAEPWLTVHRCLCLCSHSNCRLSPCMFEPTCRLPQNVFAGLPALNAPVLKLQSLSEGCWIVRVGLHHSVSVYQGLVYSSPAVLLVWPDGCNTHKGGHQYYYLHTDWTDHAI